MTEQKFRLHDGKRGVALAVRVIPGLKENQVVGILKDGTIRMRLNSSQMGDQANDVLIDFLSVLLGIPPSKIEIVAGHKGRDKLVSIIDITTETAHQKIMKHTP